MSWKLIQVSAEVLVLGGKKCCEERRENNACIFYFLFNLYCFVESIYFLNTFGNVNDFGKYSRNFS